MAYAALLSLTQILEQKLHRNPFPQTEHHLETILQRASFLLEFLERSSQKRSERRVCVESEIRDAAYRVEDLIESHVNAMDRFSSREEESFTTFSEAFKKATEELDSIMEKTTDVEEDQNSMVDLDVQDLQQQMIINPVSTDEGVIVGLDRQLADVKNRLGGRSSNIHMICIVGMFGVGKTTLAKQVYNDTYIMDRFEVRAWATASRDYDLYSTLLQLLHFMGILYDDTAMKDYSLESLELCLNQNLKDRRYLIVIDNLWDINDWDRIEHLFPDDKNGSRIILTTRQESVAVDSFSIVRYSFHVIRMDLLNKDDSWTLFCENLEREDRCPPELENIGRKIAQQCGGLPHALVVIGRYLSSVPKTLDVWKRVAINASSVLSSNDKEILKTLFLSYKILPPHLKACFLYLGIFPEEYDIPVSTILKTWVAEGFIKPNRSASLEEVAEEYLLDLIKRGLVLISKWSSTGRVKTCKIQDLLTNICVNEAKKEMFFHVTNKRLDGILEGTCVRRLSLSSKTRISEERPSTCVPRSILDFSGYLVHAAKFLCFELVKVLLTNHEYYLEFPNEITEFVNLKYLAARSERGWSLASIYKLVNLQTIIVRPKLSTYPEVFFLPPEIWNMSQLRHVQLHGAINLPDPPPLEEAEVESSIAILENLQSFGIVKNFRCTVEVLKRIPNLLKLGIYYDYEPNDWEYLCLHNLARLCRLEKVKCIFATPNPSFLQKVVFPPCLAKITLNGCWLPWEDMRILGRLPELAVLKLKHYAFNGPVWEPNEGEFWRLRFLLIEESDLEQWTAEAQHFPSLEHLIIRDCFCLEKIPQCFAELPNLESIEVRDCYDSVETSAKRLIEEQWELGNAELQLHIINDETSDSTSRVRTEE